MAFLTAVAVGAGGTAGALARFEVGERLEGRALDTFVVNILGSFLLGMVLAAPIDGQLRLAAATGFCGAFTTFSSFAVETVRLLDDGRPGLAVGYAAVTLSLALPAVVLGLALGRLVGG